ncbi:MAG: 2-dehydropantoate 2-reductase [Burkholderiales bacterium]|nr:MAG: 2-dehydropantoate 2-reductase [Burkholderiales bacterium]
MRFLVIGAGAIGGFLACRLDAAGHTVQVVARGAHLAAMRAGGLRLEAMDGTHHHTARIEALGDVNEAGPAQVVIVTLKSHQLPAMADAIAAAAEPASLLLTVQNGVGWWYFQRHGGALDGRIVQAVDPQGGLATTLPLDRLVPAFAYKSAHVAAPGLVRHVVSERDRLALGALDPSAAARIDELLPALRAAGLAPAPGDVRRWMWNKLLGNIFANPVCALTHRTLGDLVALPQTRALALALMRETAAVAAALGYPPEGAAELQGRLERARELGRAKPSMLQDREAGRPMELDAILGAVVELAALAAVEVPRIGTLLACLKLVESSSALEPESD